MERHQQGSALTVAAELLEKLETKLAALGDTREAVTTPHCKRRWPRVASSSR